MLEFNSCLNQFKLDWNWFYFVSFSSFSSFDFKYLSISTNFFTSLRDIFCVHIGQLTSVSRYLKKKFNSVIFQPQPIIKFKIHTS